MSLIVPINDNVFIRRAKAAGAQGGIILPEDARVPPGEGEVVAISREAKKSTGLIIGDRVLFQSASVREMMIGGEKFVIAHAEHVVAKFVEEEAAQVEAVPETSEVIN